MKLHEAAEGVYYVVGRSGVPDAGNQGFMSNAGFVVTSRGVVVYDALGTPSLAWKLLQKIRTVTDQPVTRVIAGHYHADHIYGLQVFKDHTDAVIWAQEDAAGYVDSRGARRRLEQRRQALFPWVDEATRLAPPDRTFAERQTFDMGGRRLELLHVGPAPRIIIPGHGAASKDTSGAIRFMRGYITGLRERMGEAVRNLRPFEQAYADADWSQYRGLPAFEATHRSNAYNVYLELQEELGGGF
ncbi:MBL fold metallo-hydrolase [Thiohalorhabdus sp. Cl-TMA]|uniref:MBL fold metallo-hydrolase n=1 Tax=Thiohalorhabdus methylotrophus TaxID=3242694 RepID=A0ABV4TW15_9GAMM